VNKNLSVYKTENFKNINKTDLYTLEMTFGSEKTVSNDDFLLVLPGHVLVNEIGDVILTDEGRIKVFDKQGKEKIIIGGIGEGPSEFITQPLIKISPKGFLTAYEPGDTRNSYYSIFDPDYNFVNKKQYRCIPILEDYLKNKNLKPENIKYITGILSLDSTSIVYELHLENEENGSFRLLLYENESTLVPLHYTKIKGDIRHGRYSYGTWNLGLVFWNILPVNKIIYIDNNEDVYYNEKEGEYTINIVSIYGQRYKKIKRRFIPKKISESAIESVDDRIRNIFPGGKGLNFEIFRRKVINKYKEKQYYPAVQGIIIDNNFVFIELGHFDEKQNILTDIYDLDTDTFVGSLYLPMEISTANCINNGYSYDIGLDEEGFYVVKKYKLQPAVYGK